jgi:serine/threonine protein kinase
MLLIDSPHVVKLHWTFQSKSELCFVMDYCPGGELFYHMQKHGKLNEDQARYYVKQVALGLNEFHQKNIVYRDLKPENLVLN